MEKKYLISVSALKLNWSESLCLTYKQCFPSSVSVDSEAVKYDDNKLARTDFVKVQVWVLIY